ncbi:BlaI/MecI/CopY family transcriptional regulator [Undibacterium cyanobacteriorum]|uniref:BlaI/MecI/CopY family transcriptional regulator n=1 Tax=Undibacterium cyanobacteriorum TaxID=3073561 RepID=A0ABY9RL19_9BURK|nr:BlaI/MecI/CopY family transcriptional regulator [Undibacterium sp. 20NA77.5]WMW80726.1 BlaI/MecI/CopY family transcriptional regulator [Undibacterium sp. 20NA77.5]
MSNKTETQNKVAKNKAAAVRKPTPAELVLLKALWQHGPGTAKQVFEWAQVERPEISQATVLRQLQMMFADGLLTRDESARSHVYAAAQAQQKLQTNLLKDFIQKAFAGSGKELIMAALKEHVSDKDRQEIQAFLHGDEK